MLEPTWKAKYINEFIGTYLLVLFGNLSVLCSAVIGAYGPSLWDCSIVFGLGVTLAIYATAAVSGAHLNPAVTIACAVHRGFPWKKVIPYSLAQTAGAFCAAATYYAAYSKWIAHFEATKHIVRGELGSQLSAMAFNGFVPNPAIGGTTPEAWSLVSLPVAFCAEAFAAMLLVYFVFCLFDDKNPASPKGNTAALVFGLFIAVIIAVEAPLTMTPINPARDFGPRLFAFLAGWGNIAIPGPRGEFWLFIIAPIVGGVIAGYVHDKLHRNFIPGYFDDNKTA